MKIDVKAVNQLIQGNYRGNKTWFCEDLGISTCYLNKVYKNPKMCKKLIDKLEIFCKENDNFTITDFIFFN